MDKEYVINTGNLTINKNITNSQVYEFIYNYCIYKGKEVNETNNFIKALQLTQLFTHNIFIVALDTCEVEFNIHKLTHNNTTIKYY